MSHEYLADTCEMLTLLPGCPSASSLMRRNRAGVGRCAEAGPVVLIRSRLKEGRARLRWEDGKFENAELPLRSCTDKTALINQHPQTFTCSSMQQRSISTHKF